MKKFLILLLLLVPVDCFAIQVVLNSSVKQVFKVEFTLANGETADSVTIPEVVLKNTIILPTGGISWLASTDTLSDHALVFHIVDIVTARVTRNTGATGLTTSATVIEYYPWAVQGHLEAAESFGVNQGEEMLSIVADQGSFANADRTLVINSGCKASNLNTSPQQCDFITKLTETGNLFIRRQDLRVAVTQQYQVIEFTKAVMPAFVEVP